MTTNKLDTKDDGLIDTTDDQGCLANWLTTTNTYD